MSLMRVGLLLLDRVVRWTRGECWSDGRSSARDGHLGVVNVVLSVRVRLVVRGRHHGGLMIGRRVQNHVAPGESRRRAAEEDRHGRVSNGQEG